MKQELSCPYCDGLMETKQELGETELEILDVEFKRLWFMQGESGDPSGDIVAQFTTDRLLSNFVEEYKFKYPLGVHLDNMVIDWTKNQIRLNVGIPRYAWDW